MMAILWRPSDRQLRQFAVLAAVFFLGLALRWSWQVESATPTAIGAGLAIFIGSIGWWKPRAIRPIYLGWMIAAFPIGWTVSRMILGILFYGVFTPLGLCFRILRRDALSLKLQPEAASYWTLKETPGDPRRYFRQY
jgi:hypothetical protein